MRCARTCLQISSKQLQCCDLCHIHVSSNRTNTVICPRNHPYDMATRRETPFPKRKPADAVKATPNVPSSIRSALHFDDDSRDPNLSNLIEDEVIELLSSSSSSSTSSDGVISLLDSTASSTGSSKTFCVTPSPSKLRSPLNRTLTARSATNTPMVSSCPQRRGGTAQKKPQAAKTNAKKVVDVPEVLRLYGTQAMAELSRLQANLAKWKMAGRQDHAYLQVLDEATKLLAEPGSEFQAAVEEAIQIANKDAEMRIASKYTDLQQKVSQVYKDFACIPPEVMRTPVTMRSKLPAKCGRSVERPASAMMSGPCSTPRIFKSVSMCSRLATPSKLIITRTPNSARSKIPVL